MVFRHKKPRDSLRGFLHISQYYKTHQAWVKVGSVSAITLKLSYLLICFTAQRRKKNAGTIRNIPIMIKSNGMLITIKKVPSILSILNCFID